MLDGVDALDGGAMCWLASSCGLLLNCMRYSEAPYASALEACLAAGADYVDISADPGWIGRVLGRRAQRRLQPAVAAAGRQQDGTGGAGAPAGAAACCWAPADDDAAATSVAVPGCGFDYVLPSLAALHAARQLPVGARLQSLRATLRVKLGRQGLVVRAASVHEVLRAMSGERQAGGAAASAERPAAAANRWRWRDVLDVRGWPQLLPLWFDGLQGCWAVRAPGTQLEQELVASTLAAHLPQVLPQELRHMMSRPSITCGVALPSLLLVLLLLWCLLLAAAVARLPLGTRLLRLLAPWLARLMGARVAGDDAEALAAIDGMSFEKRYELRYTREDDGAAKAGMVLVDVVGEPGCMKALTVNCLLAASLGLLLQRGEVLKHGRQHGGGAGGGGVPLRGSGGAVALGPGELLGGTGAWERLSSLGLFQVKVGEYREG